MTNIDADLKNRLIAQIAEIRQTIDEIADTQLRQKVDKRATEAFLLIRDGHLKNLNGGCCEKNTTQ